MDAGANSLFLKIEYLLDCYENQTERQSIRNAQGINLTQKELTEKINDLYRQLPKQSGNDTPEYRSLESRVKHMNDRESSTWRAFKASASSTKSALDKQLIQAAKNIELEEVLSQDLSHVSLRVLQEIYDISNNETIKAAIDQRIRDMTQVSVEAFSQQEPSASPLELLQEPSASPLELLQEPSAPPLELLQEPSAPPLELLQSHSEILLGQEFNRVFSEYPLTHVSRQYKIPPFLH